MFWDQTDVVEISELRCQNSWLTLGQEGEMERRRFVTRTVRLATAVTAAYQRFALNPTATALGAERVTVMIRVGVADSRSALVSIATAVGQRHTRDDYRDQRKLGGQVAN
jgi:hypothetical protein